MQIVKCKKWPLRLLMSDVHIGSHETDYKTLKAELKLAKERNAVVWVNGDLFDSIVPKDKKFQPACYHKRIQGKNDVVGEQIKWGLELFDGVNLEMVGWGNHDEWLEKFYGFNAVKSFIEQHNRDAKMECQYGGYSGYLSAPDILVYYHHGSGGGSSLGSAISEFEKKLQFTDGKTDLVWMGHKHHRIFTHLRRVIAGRGKKPNYKDVKFIMSGAYMDTMSNEQGSYGEVKGYKTQGKGGAWITDGCKSVIWE